jgi:hypothetical protein
MRDRAASAACAQIFPAKKLYIDDASDVIKTVRLGLGAVCLSEEQSWISA